MIINSVLSDLDLAAFEGQGESRSSLLAAGLWPDSLPSVTDYVTDSAISRLRNASAPFLYLLNQLSLDKR